MVNGTPLTLFNSFMDATGPLLLTGPNEVINNAQQNRSFSFGALMGGDRGMKQMLTGGTELRFQIFFETGGRTRFHQPGATQNWAQPQKLTHGRAHWRFLITDMAWTIQEIMLNEKLRSARTEYEQFQQYANLKRHYEQVMWTDKWDFLENHAWSEPDFNEMEAAAGGEFGKWYSIPAFINEYTNGLFNSEGSTPAGTAWTTIHGINPASTTLGQNRFMHNTAVYSNEGTNATTSPSASSKSLLGAFENMWQKCHWEKPPTQKEYFEGGHADNQQIFCSKEGQRAYQTFLRSFQDLFVIETRQDPAYPDPAFNFIPVKFVPALTSATLYPNHTTSASITDNVAEGTSGNGITGPRFYWINSNYLYPCFHEEMFFARQKVREHFNDPDTFVQPVRTWGNFKCASRLHQGLISPSVDLYSYLYV